MKRIAILGCENSHANNFLSLIRKEKRYSDIEVVGVHSSDKAAADKLSEQFSVPVLESADAAVGKIDGLIITARHGGYHYELAKPYLKSGIPMFIDKPITVSEEDAQAFKKALSENNIRVSGGSSLMFAPRLDELKAKVDSGECGKVIGGYFKAPVNLDNPYGGFFFYAQHLVAMVTKVFGNYPESVYVKNNGKQINGIISYEGFDISLNYTDGNYIYYASVAFEKCVDSGELTTDNIFADEFETYYKLLMGESEGENLDDFFAPVYVMNAMVRSMDSGKAESISYPSKNNA